MSTAACPECGCEVAHCTRCGNVADWNVTDAGHTTQGDIE